ncbi:beta-1,3-galactosyltransferase 1-like [Saccoglossus kowalevskii]|uniref:Hexosyltransferase n=1 Tax=Saccoglossus kowalevskii TaxID=10224 RepID=A0ABM0GYA4_SACKO|nr:PREDICTED: beta-1,3-galactosyltransferase 1-like [Saccoglossus kowalevskii]
MAKKYRNTGRKRNVLLLFLLVSCNVFILMATLYQLLESKQLLEESVTASTELTNDVSSYFAGSGDDEFSDPTQWSITKTQEQFSAILSNYTLTGSNVNNFDFPYLFNPSGICNVPRSINNVFVLMMTPISPLKADKRAVIRNVRGRLKEVDGYQIRHVFVMGRPTVNVSSILNTLKLESDTFMDLVVLDFDDSYYNLTLKTMMLLRWAVTYCPNAKYVMKVDDDVFVNLDNLIPLLSEAPREGYAVGYVYVQSKPIRKTWNKWYVSEEEWSYEFYPPYPTGPAYVLSMDVARAVLKSARRIRMFRMEDVYIGMNLLKLSIKPVHHNGFDRYGICQSLPCCVRNVIATHYITSVRMATLPRRMEQLNYTKSCHATKVIKKIHRLELS